MSQDLGTGEPKIEQRSSRFVPPVLGSGLKLLSGHLNFLPNPGSFRVLGPGATAPSKPSTSRQVGTNRVLI